MGVSTKGEGATRDGFGKQHGHYNTSALGYDVLSARAWRREKRGLDVRRYGIQDDDRPWYAYRGVIALHL